MSMGLTHGQAKCLEFIVAHIRAYGRAPSNEKIRAHLGVKSRSNVCRLLDILVERGLIIRRIRGRDGWGPRIEVLRAADGCPSPHCACQDCADARYVASLRMIQAVCLGPDRAVLNAVPDNIRVDVDKRISLLGLKPFKAARVRGAALPTVTQ